MESAWIAKLGRHAIFTGGLVDDGWPTDVAFHDGQIHLSGEYLIFVSISILTSSRQNKTKPDLLTKINIVTALAVITVEASVKLIYVVLKAASELRCLPYYM